MAIQDDLRSQLARTLGSGSGAAFGPGVGAFIPHNVGAFARYNPIDELVARFAAGGGQAPGLGRSVGLGNGGARQQVNPGTGTQPYGGRGVKAGGQRVATDPVTGANMHLGPGQQAPPGWLLRNASGGLGNTRPARALARQSGFLGAPVAPIHVHTGPTIIHPMHPAAAGAATPRTASLVHAIMSAGARPGPIVR